jgi:hypothetical protein
MAAGKCSTCGAELVVAIDGPFAGAEPVSTVCPACADRQFLEQGGAVLTLRREPEGARFPLGKVTVTPGAVAALAESGQHAAAFLTRHACGDWGEFGQCDQIELTEDERRRGWEATDDSGKINKWNLLNHHDTIMSEYRTERGKRLWVLTALGRGGGTTVLLPTEY